MTSITTAEQLAQLSEEELSSILSEAWASPNPIEFIGLVVQERIRRHALVCQNLECGFSPMD